MERYGREPTGPVAPGLGFGEVAAGEVFFSLSLFHFFLRVFPSFRFFLSPSLSRFLGSTENGNDAREGGEGNRKRSHRKNDDDDEEHLVDLPRIETHRVCVCAKRRRRFTCFYRILFAHSRSR